MKHNFKKIEEDGITIYDESDDFFSGEEHILEVDDEIDIEYFERAWNEQQEREAAEARSQRWVSVSVIVGIILYIIAVCYITCLRELH